MTDTLPRTGATVRPAGIATALAGAVVVVLGTVGAVAPDAVGAAWFATVVPAALLFAAGLVGLRRLAVAVGASGLVTVALAVAAAAMTLFGLAHAYALVDEDTAILLFSVFMVLAAVGLIVAAVGMVRGPAALPRWATLAAGAWPLATIPAGAALGDLPHFGAIAVWGVTWVVLGATLIRTGSNR
ncbi:hypothetical protein ACQPX6_09430 [Actinomycetospora sp. CA-101289]|uniref:hypothetical protein n=1 Tax=Actinomycetospora sp. CA-101289 TaxID=3239893 RepID=UPI003D98AEF3